MKIAVAFGLVIALQTPFAARAITINTVPIGNPNNAGDIQTGVGAGIYGSVSTNYRIATTEVTNAQYASFLNAVAAADQYALYNTNMGFYTRGGILRSGSAGSYTYSVKPDVPNVGPGGTAYSYGDKPVVFVSWFDAIRFTNWVNNGATPGAPTETGAYTILGGSAIPSNANSISRNAGATWFLPTENQWYKAAYYDGTANIYYDYPTKHDAVPNNQLPTADTGNSANFYVGGYTQDESYPMTSVGAYALSASAYGTYDQGGNAWEWTETVGTTSSTRIRRGGAYDSDSTTLASSGRDSYNPGFELEDMGFRLATIPMLPGDYNANGIVDAADYVLYRKYLGQSFTLPNDTTPGTVTSADFDVWRSHFGQTPSGSGAGSLLQAAVPEPATIALSVVFAFLALSRRRSGR